MPEKIVTRRDLLKIVIAAGTSVSIAGFLPDKWIKPAVISGVLPVHAQTSVLSACPQSSYIISTVY